MPKNAAAASPRTRIVVGRPRPALRVLSREQRAHRHEHHGQGQHHQPGSHRGDVGKQVHGQDGGRGQGRPAQGQPGDLAVRVLPAAETAQRRQHCGHCQDHEPHDAQEHPTPTNGLSCKAGGKRADQRRNDPGRGKSGENLRVQAWNVDPCHHHVQRHGAGATAESLDQPSGHQRLHARRQAA